MFAQNKSIECSFQESIESIRRSSSDMTHFKVLSIGGDSCKFSIEPILGRRSLEEKIGSREKRQNRLARFNGNFPARSLVFCSCAHLSLIKNPRSSTEETSVCWCSGELNKT
jgi:hypothetical protein